MLFLAHLQGIQSQYTKLTLQKRVALFQRFQAHPASLDTDIQLNTPGRRGEHTTWVLPKCRLKEAVFQLLFFNLVSYSA